MTIYSVYDKTTKESETYYSLSAAKKAMKELTKQGHEVVGDKTRIYSNGDWIPCGEITLSGSNKSFVANSRMTKANY